MKSCWETLGIEKTGDIDAIRRARRLLMKQWHPDIAVTEPERHDHTLRCMEINAAFDAAVRLAECWNAVPLTEPHGSGPAAAWGHGSIPEIGFGKHWFLALIAALLLVTFQTFLLVFFTVAALAAVIGVVVLAAACVALAIPFVSLLKARLQRCFVNGAAEFSR